MNRITVIGLGAMGRALAQALLTRGYEVTVWNRTAARAKPLLANGARHADSLADAIRASEAVLFCISDYAGAYALLDQPGVAESIDGRCVIHLSTGTPSDARQMGQWIDTLGGSYIDGAIMAYPPNIGEDTTQLLIAGKEQSVSRVQHFLAAFGGDIRHVGSEIGAAAALDMAVVSRLIAITPAVIHGALICEAEGVSLEQFADLFAPGDRARSVALAIHNADYEDKVTVSVDVAISVASSIRRHAETTQINSEFPDFILGLYERAAAAGQRQHDASSLIRILRQ